MLELLSILLALSLVLIMLLAWIAVSRHRFGPRRTAVKLSVYTISMLSIALVFSAALIASLSLVGNSGELSVQQSALVVAMAVGASIIYGPMRQMFDNILRPLFYANSYSPEELLSEFSASTAANYELHPLIGSSSQIIRDNIYPEEIGFILQDGPDSAHVYGGFQSIYEELGYDSFSELLAANDSLDTKSSKHSSSSRTGCLEAAGVRLIYRLSVGSMDVGYMLLGNKKGAEDYDAQDLRVLSTISGELAVAAQNAARYEQIERFTETLKKEVEVATRKLQKSNEKLKALDEAKDEFISMASHQLSTPLTSIKGYISIVMDGDAGKISKQQSELLDQAYISSQRMVYLIADLLNVSRLRTGKFVIERSPTNLAEVVAGEVRQLKQTVKVRGLKIKYTEPKDFPQYKLDETKIRQVVMNFIDNAVYYTPKGGTIEVQVKSTRSKLEFTVTDDGMGVSREDIPNLFTKFYRAGSARKARPDGTGLGLYMAKKVIVAQGGSIIFKSKEGKGSTFGFSFPVSAVKLD